MRIGIVGGLDRNGSSLRLAAAAAGHEVEVHTGRLSPRSAAGLRALVERSDVVLVLTDVNSHGAVKLARSWARQRCRPVHLVRRCSVSGLQGILRKLEQRPATARALRTSKSVEIAENEKRASGRNQMRVPFVAGA